MSKELDKVGTTGIGTDIKHSAEPSKTLGSPTPGNADVDVQKLIAERDAWKEKAAALAQPKESPKTVDMDIESIVKGAVAAALQAQNVAPQSNQGYHDGINRSSSFKSSVDNKVIVDGQRQLSNFRNEPTKPLVIPKSIGPYVGDQIALTVNGVRICIPADGRTYEVNVSHYEHFRERIAKVELLTSKDDQMFEE